MTASIGPQTSSRLFHLPIEVRHAIYHKLTSTNEIHAFLHEGKLQFADCLSPEADLSGWSDGSERKTTGDWNTDHVWMRRLQSSWGPHWKCEEVALGLDDTHESNKAVSECTYMTLLLVCKWIFRDVSNFIARMVAVHVTDLESLGFLLNKAALQNSLNYQTTMFLTNIRELRITLKLPLSVCNALEDLEPTNAATGEKATKWRNAFAAMPRLQKLKRLHIWLDHTDSRHKRAWGIGVCYWTSANERAVLAPLIPLLNSSQLDVNVYLPKLHPQKATPDRHFMDDESDPRLPFKIHRVLRQRYFVRASAMYRTVIHQPDFPFFYNHPFFEGCSNEEVEEKELEMWQSGLDAKRLAQTNFGTVSSSGQDINAEATFKGIDEHVHGNDDYVPFHCSIRYYLIKSDIFFIGQVVWCG